MGSTVYVCHEDYVLADDGDIHWINAAQLLQCHNVPKGSKSMTAEYYRKYRIPSLYTNCTYIDLYVRPNGDYPSYA